MQTRGMDKKIQTTYYSSSYKTLYNFLLGIISKRSVLSYAMRSVFSSFRTFYKKFANKVKSVFKKLEERVILYVTYATVSLL